MGDINVAHFFIAANDTKLIVNALHAQALPATATRKHDFPRTFPLKAGVRHKTRVALADQKSHSENLVSGEYKAHQQACREAYRVLDS